MSDNIYKYSDGKFNKTEVLELTVKELMSGPYVLRYKCDNLMSIYFAGLAADAQKELIEKGRLVLPMQRFVDECVHAFYYHSCEEMDWKEDVKNWTVKELMSKFERLQRGVPQHVTIVDKNKIDSYVS